MRVRLEVRGHAADGLAHPLQGCEGKPCRFLHLALHWGPWCEPCLHINLSHGLVTESHNVIFDKPGNNIVEHTCSASPCQEELSHSCGVSL